jgi:hypothetical protein
VCIRLNALSVGFFSTHLENELPICCFIRVHIGQTLINPAMVRVSVEFSLLVTVSGSETRKPCFPTSTCNSAAVIQLQDYSGIRIMGPSLEIGVFRSVGILKHDKPATDRGALITMSREFRRCACRCPLTALAWASNRNITDSVARGVYHGYVRG